MMMTARQLILGTSVIGGLVLAAGANPAQAAFLSAQEAGCGGQDVCFVPDGNFDITPFTQTNFNSTTDTVTGSGAFFANSPATGHSTVYLTEANGTTVSDILSLTYSNSGAAETITASWQSDGPNDTINLAPLPAGAHSVIETGSSQDVTALLGAAAVGGFPSNITVLAQSDVEPVPVPKLGPAASMVLLALGLLARSMHEESTSP
jgi:hypothetical protein